MSAIHIKVPQRSPEWFAARCGCVTGSVAAAVLAQGKGTTRLNLRAKLVAERLTGQPEIEDFTNGHMERGRELEPAARRAFEAVTGQLVDEVGFLRHPELWAGCSLDGLLEDAILELKCKSPARHLAHLRLARENRILDADDTALESDHRRQVLHNCFIAERPLAYLVSYSEAYPGPLRLAIVRVQPTDAQRASYELALRQFLREVDRDIEEIRSWGAVSA